MPLRPRCSPWLLLGALLFGAEAAAATLALPPGERSADWAGPLALAGLQAGDGGARIEAGPGGWTLVVQGPDGLRRAPVAIPHTAAEREHVALLAASLLQQGPAVGGLAVAPPPPPPAPPPTPRARPPAPVIPHEGPGPVQIVTLEPVEPAEPAEPPAPPPPAEAAPPSPPPPPPPQLHLQLAGGLTLRRGCAPQGDLTLGLRRDTDAAYVLAEVDRPSSIAVDADARLHLTALSLRAGPQSRGHRAGLGLGLQHWALTEEGYPDQIAWGLAAGAEAGQTWPIGPAQIDLSLVGELDLMGLSLQGAATRPGRAAASLRLGLLFF